MQINRMTVKNFRMFKDHTFDFASRFNVLVGDNGTGKTSVLKALSKGLSKATLGDNVRRLASSIEDEDVRRCFFLRGSTLTVEQQHPASIGIRGTDQADNSLTLSVRESGAKGNLQDLTSRDFEREIRTGSDQTLPIIANYGSERLWIDVKVRDVQTNGPESRFAGYENCLNSASNQSQLLRWFKTQEFIALQRKEPVPALEACREAIVTCVREASHVYFDVSYDELILVMNGEGVPFSYLSDGYRNILALVADIAVRCATLNPHLENNVITETRGVVLIDELDLHLHPKWQRRIVGDLMSAFPNIQFITTSHSPFVIQSLPKSDTTQLVNLDTNERSHADDQSIEDIVETIQGVELPQHSKRYLEMKETAKSYFQLLENESADSDEQRTLRNRLNELAQPFSHNPAYSALVELRNLSTRGSKPTEESP